VNRSVGPTDGESGLEEVDGGRTDADRAGWLISVDDHVIEPPHVWQSRAPARDHDRVPRVVSDGDVDFWVYEDVRMPITSLLVQAGSSPENVVPRNMSYRELRPEIYDSSARVADLDRDNVLASACFPFFPRYCGQTFLEASDRSLALQCVRSYNDWMIEEWCGEAPGRFIPLVIMPLWDSRLAAAEIERCAEKGAKAICFSENPSKLGLPSIHDPEDYWEPVLAAANDTAMPLCIHFGSSSMVPSTSPDAPQFVPALLSPLNLAYCLADWLFCGKLDPYPDLKICLSEGGIGWIPYLLERAEYILGTMEWALRFDVGNGKIVPRERWDLTPPSDVFKAHVYGCFIDDAFGAANLERIGVDNVMMETDYPHGDTSFPLSRARSDRLLAGYSVEVKYKVRQGNARRVFNL